MEREERERETIGVTWRDRETHSERVREADKKRGEKREKKDREKLLTQRATSKCYLNSFCWALGLQDEGCLDHNVACVCVAGAPQQLWGPPCSSRISHWAPM